MAVGHPVAADEPDPSMARVVTGQSKPSECLSAIAVNRVDGAQRSLSNQAFARSSSVPTRIRTYRLKSWSRNCSPGVN
jgi:hypothetical protein